MKNVDTLKELLIDCLVEDLMDPEKRGPGLYQVVARVISDNKPTKEESTSIRTDILENMAPFKMRKQA
jgi:hypothetical protein